MIDPKTAQRISRLEARLRARFDIVQEPVPVGPLRVMFTRVRDPETVLNELCDKIDRHERLTGQRIHGDQLGLPYWAELWDSSIGVGQWLVAESGQSAVSSRQFNAENATSSPANCPPLTAHSVLDLGCGMGLAGTVAAMLGADVTFADIESESLLFALLNGLSYNPRVRARRVDWQSDDLEQRFDLIIGSDVLYERSQWGHLDAFFRRHLAKNGKIILGEPGRQTGDIWLDWIADKRWTLKRHTQTVPTRTTPIRLFELRYADER